MLPAGTQPILGHVLDALIDAGITDIHLVVGYKADRVRSYFGPTYRNVALTYHTQTNQLGSGHALLQAREGVDDSFLLVNGDQVIDARIVEQVSDSHSSAATLAVVEGSQAANYGAVTLDDDEITTLTERPSEGDFRLFNAGVYALTQAIFETLDTLSVDRGELPITDAVQAMIDDTDHTVSSIRTDHFWMDATHPWDLLSLSQELLSRGWVDPSGDDNRYIAETANIHPDATLVAPVVIDSDAVVEASAVVGPYAAVGESATVGAGAILRDVVIDTDTTVGPNTTATELVVGQGCKLGPALTASGGPADIVLNEEVYSDINLGGVIADRVDIGGNATLEPGALIGPSVTVSDGVVVGGHVEADSEVVR
jgi:glucose-1-phosphate thymidylyltransferase